MIDDRSRIMENVKYLEHSWSFEKFGHSLHLLGMCLDGVNESDKRIANILFNKLTSQSNMSESYKNTLVYVQGMELLKANLK